MEAAAFVIEYKLEDGNLVAHPQGQPSLPLTALSDTSFSYKGVDAQVIFHLGEEGVNSATHHQGGGKMKMIRMTYKPGAEVLTDFIGNYYSEELQTLYRFVIKEEKLVAEHMNMDDIEHVSYTIMDLHILANEYLVIATDANRHFVVRIGDNQPLREFYGHDADSYGQPRLVVDSTQKYVISNTQKTGELVIWSLASQQVVKRLTGHSAMVRDIAYCSHEEEQILVSVSYDKAVRVWAA